MSSFLATPFAFYLFSPIKQKYQTWNKRRSEIIKKINKFHVWTKNSQHNIQPEHQTASVRRSRQRKQGLKTTTSSLSVFHEEFSSHMFVCTCRSDHSAIKNIWNEREMSAAAKKFPAKSFAPTQLLKALESVSYAREPSHWENKLERCWQRLNGSTAHENLNKI